MIRHDRVNGYPAKDLVSTSQGTPSTKHNDCNEIIIHKPKKDPTKN